jgi:UDP-N-acetylglucosamine 2-epimerase (non-hydrolysing)
MKSNQTLFDLTSDSIKGLEKVIDKSNPDLIIVQGDTTTAFSGALSAFYKKVKLGHLEAGLRSYNKQSPFPEEINRVLISQMADYHFAPTISALKNLENEGIKQNLWSVGNTVIDALFLGLELLQQKNIDYTDFFKDIDFSKRVILVTGHRRESFGLPFQNICVAIREISRLYDNIELVYPVHLNPNVKNTVFSYLEGIKNVHLLEPLEYPKLIWLMNKCFMVMTDSGGIQEEAPSLGKPVIVMRDVTERVEGIDAGTAILVGTDRKKIVEETDKILSDKELYERMSNAHNPYGDGLSSKRVSEIIKDIK